MWGCTLEVTGLNPYYEVQVNCTNLHKKPRAWRHTFMDSADRQHLEGGLEPMLELKDWTLSRARNMCRSLISSGTQNMYRDERWSNTSHDGGPDGKISPSDGSVSTIEGEKQRQSATWSRHRPVDQEVWRINEVQMFKCPEEKTKALLGSVQIDLKE